MNKNLNKNEKQSINEKKIYNLNKIIIDKNNKIRICIEGIKMNESKEENETIKEYKSKYYLLEKEKNDLRNELEKQKNKNDELNNMYKNLENRYGIIDLQKKQLTQKNKKYENEIKELNNKIKKNENRIELKNKNKQKENNEDEEEFELEENKENVNNINNGTNINKSFDIIKESSKEEDFDTESNKSNNNNECTYEDLVLQNKKLKSKIKQLKIKQ